MKTKATVTIKNKRYTYTLEKVAPSIVHLVSKDACIDQDFLAEDIPDILIDLPQLIIAEQKYTQKQSDVIRFRISSTERACIEKKAVENGYTSISGYIRDCAMQKVRQ